MTNQRYRELRLKLDFARRPLRLVIHLVLDALLLAGVLALMIQDTQMGYWLGQIGLAVFFFRSFCIMHEAVHGNITKSKLSNDLLGILYGSFCFLPFFNWRTIHLEHHRWAGNIDKDPSMKLILGYHQLSSGWKASLKGTWKTWIPLLGFMQNIVFWKASFNFVLDSEQTLRSRARYLASLLPPAAALATLVGAGMLIAFPLGLFPSILLYLAMVEAVNLPHHLETNFLRGESKLFYKDQYRVARSCEYTNWVSGFVFLNFNLHSEHHMYPDLPWHQLPKAHQLLTQEQLEDYRMDKGFAWIVRARQSGIEKTLDANSVIDPNGEKIAA